MRRLHTVLHNGCTSLHSHQQCVLLVLFSPSVVSNSLHPRGPQHPRPPYPLPSPRACSNSGQWCHPTISRFSTSSPTLVISCVLAKSHSNRCEMICHCGWVCLSSMTSGFEHLSRTLNLASWSPPPCLSESVSSVCWYLILPDLLFCHLPTTSVLGVVFSFLSSSEYTDEMMEVIFLIFFLLGITNPYCQWSTV